MIDHSYEALREGGSSRLGALALAIALAAVLLSMVALLLLPADAAAAPRLRAAPMATGPMVTLGDLFEDIPAKAAATVVARAPAPGNTLSFDPRALSDRALSLGVVWTPSPGMKRIVVGGVGAEDALLQPIETDAADNAPVGPTLPVLTRAVVAGDVIASSAIALEAVEGRLPSDAITALDRVIGKVARRPLTAGRALRSSDLSAPLAIKKGDPVTMIFTAGAVRLTARGRALDDAALGDPVRVLNLASNRTIDATATATGEARVQPATTLPTQAVALATPGAAR